MPHDDIPRCMQCRQPDHEGACDSQARFEALFDHEPMVDTRTPADVKAQKKAEGWK